MVQSKPTKQMTMATRMAAALTPVMAPRRVGGGSTTRPRPLVVRRRNQAGRTRALDEAAQHVATVMYTLADAADATAEVAVQTTKKGGLIGPLADAMEVILKMLNQGLEGLHVPYAYGFSIILLTVLVKAATYPLSKKQVESTMAMQALQPSIKEIQTKYKHDQERLQVETARLYKEAGVNPLAGCLPTLATIPVWIGLYRALQNAAAEGVLTEGFFWIPSLAGPTSIAKQTAGAGMAWLFPLQDGAPPVGWHDAVAYLVLPVLLIISQYVSQKIISPQQSADPSQKQANAILQFLPLMIGYFSLNVPSGLTLYWFTNNILTTAQQVFLRRTAPAPAIPSSAPIRKSVPAASSTKASRKAERAKKANATSTASLGGNGSAEKGVGKSDFFGGDSFSEVRELPAVVKDQDHEDEGVSVPDGPPAKESAGESGSTSAASEPQSKQQLSRKARKKNKKRA